MEASAEWADAIAEISHPPRTVRAEVMALAIGELTLVLLPGEPFVELGQAIKQGASQPVLVLGYANGSPGYLPDRSAYAEGGYNVVEAHRFYGQPAAFAPEARHHDGPTNRSADPRRARARGPGGPRASISGDLTTIS